MQLTEVMNEIEALRDPAVLAVNARHGDDHAVKLADLRALAKRIKKNQDLARELWATGNSDAQLLTTLICRPNGFTADELDAMIDDANTPKLLDWFVSYVVKPSKHAETLRVRWKDAPDTARSRAGWSLTTTRVVKKPEGLDLVRLLDEIEAEMKQAPGPKQWAMNHCLAEIGIRNPELRARAIDIGERLEVLKDYPASPGCTPPYAPLWINEMVRRLEA